MYEPLADYGCKRVLGMGGSITGYINTGNPYHPKYYQRVQKNDEFMAQTKKETKKQNKLSVLALVGSLALIGGIFALGKKGGKGKVSETLKTGFSKIKNLFSKNAAQDAAEGAQKSSFKEKMKGFFKKAKNEAGEATKDATKAATKEASGEAAKANQDVIKLSGEVVNNSDITGETIEATVKNSDDIIPDLAPDEPIIKNVVNDETVTPKTTSKAESKTSTPDEPIVDTTSKAEPKTSSDTKEFIDDMTDDEIDDFINNL